VPLVVTKVGAVAGLVAEALAGAPRARLRIAEQLAQLLELLARDLTHQVGDVEAEPFDLRSTALRDAQVGAALEQPAKLVGRNGLRAAAAVIWLVGKLQWQLFSLRLRVGIRRRRTYPRRVGRRRTLVFVVDVLI